jgi:uncharacterized protein (DUF433 family)
MATRKQTDPAPTEAVPQTNGPAPSGPETTSASPPSIVNNRVAGTRITVWDIVCYLEAKWSHEDIAEILGITVDQVRVAVQYISDNEAQVMEVHRKIEERNARGNPPEVQAKLDSLHVRFTEYVKRVREGQSKETNRDRNRGR